MIDLQRTKPNICPIWRDLFSVYASDLFKAAGGGGLQPRRGEAQQGAGEAGEQGLEIAPRNLKQGPEFAPKTVLVET